MRTCDAAGDDSEFPGLDPVDTKEQTSIHDDDDGDGGGPVCVDETRTPTEAVSATRPSPDHATVDRHGISVINK